jgi:hypothetical protein
VNTSIQAYGGFSPEGKCFSCSAPGRGSRFDVAIRSLYGCTWPAASVPSTTPETSKGNARRSVRSLLFHPAAVIERMLGRNKLSLGACGDRNHDEQNLAPVRNLQIFISYARKDNYLTISIHFRGEDGSQRSTPRSLLTTAAFLQNHFAYFSTHGT